MALEDIKTSLEKRFSESLPEFYNRRIIFWNDEEREFAGEIGELELSNAEVLILSENNNFQAKKLLSCDDFDNNYLVYNPFDYDIEDDWLLDIKLYSEEFRADQLSMWMQEMNIEQIPAVRSQLKVYKGFLNAASRRKLISQFGSEITSASSLKLAVLASICKVKDLSPKEIIRAVMADGPDLENDLKMEMLKYNASETFWRLVEKMTRYSSEGSPNIDDMNIHIVLSALTNSLQEKYLAGLEARYSAFASGFCYELIYEWLHSDKKDELVEVMRTVEQSLKLAQRFDKLEISDLVDTEILPCIDDLVLSKLMEKVVNNTINPDEIIAVIEKRRSMIWYSDSEPYYNALMQVALMKKFKESHIQGFHHAIPKDMWDAYASDYYRMDSYYRAFHVEFAKNLTAMNEAVDDIFKSVVDEVEGLYKNWYLDKLAENWTNIIAEDLENQGVISGVPLQDDFYKREVKTCDNKVFVIVSDALRYDVAYDISEQLRIETKADVKIKSQQSVYPSKTEFGMAALLPHKKLSLASKPSGLNVLCDGMTTEMADRDNILKTANPNSIAVRYKDLILMKRDEQRELVKGMDIVYIYHDTIDSMGHNDEMNVLPVCESAKAEIVALVKLITGALNGVNVVITSDHGFLYTYKPLGSDEKMERSSFKDNIVKQGRRYVITDFDARPDFLIPVKGFYNEDGFMAFTPRENIRIKGSGGQNFVHGGASLQEMVVPVINYKFLRAGSKGYENNRDKYDAKPVSLSLLSSSRKISNMIFSMNFYQKEAVKDNFVPCTYEVFMTDEDGNKISDVQKIIADRSSEANVDREYRVTFNLKQQKYNRFDTYFLVIQDMDGIQMPVKEAMEIDISIGFTEFEF